MPIINNTAAAIRRLPFGTVLKPGLSEMTDEAWGKIKGQKSIQRRIADGTLKIEKHANGPVNDATGGEAGASFDINADATESMRFVGMTFDRNLLAKWGKEAKNKDVKDAIDKQLGTVGLSEEEREAALKKQKHK